MIVTLRIPDEVYDKYAKRDQDHPARAMETQLTRFSDIGAHDRALVLSTGDRMRLEKLLERNLANGAELYDAVKKLTVVDLDGVKIELTESQRRRLADQARFWAQDPNKYGEATIRRVLADGLGL